MRIRRSLLGPAVVTVLVASPAPVFASPMQDLRRGTALFVRVAHATVEGQPYSADYVPLAKPAGSLDLVLDAAALGIDYDAVFHLTGVAAGDQIVWTFDETPATPRASSTTPSHRSAPRLELTAVSRHVERGDGVVDQGTVRDRQLRGVDAVARRAPARQHVQELDVGASLRVETVLQKASCDRAVHA